MTMVTMMVMVETVMMVMLAIMRTMAMMAVMTTWVVRVWESRRPSSHLLLLPSLGHLLFSRKKDLLA